MIAKRHWIAVACAAHVRRGREQGFMQVCHGKAAPLKRISPFDMVAYYSPTMVMGQKEKCQCFTAIGQVADGLPYQADMGGGFVPFRRDVRWWQSQEAPIKPLLPVLEFCRANPQNWGYRFRFGLFEISEHDMEEIAHAMSAAPQLVAPQMSS